MKASYSWLKEFIDIDLSPEELAHRLTMAGFEVEAVEKAGDDTVLDISVTPNRPDCLSIRGIARELSAVLERPLKEISAVIDHEEGEGPPVEIVNQELCPRYSARIISGVKPGPSPDWLISRLESCGVRATSNIVDVTNYVMLELGQPLHAFDLETLAGKKIVVKQADSTGSFTTLDGEERRLPKETLLIWDGERPVAVAGVMGGRNTEVSSSTTGILLESAFFNPSSIRRASKALNLSTESSYRFERGIDCEGTAAALDRAALLIRKLAGGRISRMTDQYPRKHEPRKITLSVDRVSSVIGLPFEREVIQKTLVNLGFAVSEHKGEKPGGGEMTVVPPSFRNDVEQDVDIMEEVVRIYGYDRLPSTLPVMQMSYSPGHRKQELIRSLKDAMVRAGYSEAINFSFMNPDAADRLNLPPGDRRRNFISVKNPLRKEDSAMRTTLVPAILANVGLNLNRGEKMLRMFEIARVFHPGDGKLPHEITQMAAVFHKDSASVLWLGRHEGFYDLKGVLESIFAGMNIRDLAFMKTHEGAEPYLHPGKSGSIFICNEKVGSIGVLHPAIADAFDIRGDITIAEIHDLEQILEIIPLKNTYAALPKYPCIERDAALVLSDDVTAAKVTKEVLSVQSDIIESVNLFDIYTGKPIPKGKKSIAFSIRYRAADRTLTDSEVDKLHAEIISRLEGTLKAELRG